MQQKGASMLWFKGILWLLEFHFTTRTLVGCCKNWYVKIPSNFCWLSGILLFIKHKRTRGASYDSSAMIQDSGLLGVELKRWLHVLTTHSTSYKWPWIQGDKKKKLLLPWTAFVSLLNTGLVNTRLSERFLWQEYSVITKSTWDEAANRISRLDEIDIVRQLQFQTTNECWT